MPRTAKIEPFHLQVGDVFTRVRRPNERKTRYKSWDNSPAARFKTGKEYVVLHREHQKIEGEFSRARLVCARLHVDRTGDITTSVIKENFLVRAYDQHYFGKNLNKDVPVRVLYRVKDIWVPINF